VARERRTGGKSGCGVFSVMAVGQVYRVVVKALVVVLVNNGNFSTQQSRRDKNLKRKNQIETELLQAQYHLNQRPQKGLWIEVE
jgi:hypothetical protein